MAKREHESKLPDILILLGLTTFSLLIYPAGYVRFSYPTHGVVEYLGAVRVLEGQMPHTDFVTYLYLGFDLLLSSLTFRVLGVSLSSLHTLLLLLGVAQTVLLYLLARRSVSPLWALLGAGGSVFWGVGCSLGFMVTWICVVLGLGAMWVLGVPSEESSKWRILLAGVLCGLSFLVKPTIGAFHLSAIWVYFAWLRLTESRQASSTGSRALLGLWIGIFVICAALYQGVIVRGGQNFNLMILLVALTGPPVWVALRRLLARETQTLPRPLWVGLGEMTLAGAGFLLALAVYVSIYFASSGSEETLAAFGRAYTWMRSLSSEGRQPFSLLESPQQLETLLRLAIGVGGLVVLARLFGARRRLFLAVVGGGFLVVHTSLLALGTPWDSIREPLIGLYWEAIQIVPVLVLSFLLLTFVRPLSLSDRAGWAARAVILFAAFHYFMLPPLITGGYFLMASTSAFVILVYAIRAIGWETPVRLGFSTGAVLFTLGFSMGITAWNIDHRRDWVWFPEEGLQAYIQADRSERVRELEAAIHRLSGPGEAIFAPDFPELYPITGRPNATNNLYLSFNSSPPVQSRLIEDLTGQPAAVIITPSSLGGSLAEFLDRYYMPVDEVAGIKILVPRPPPGPG